MATASSTAHGSPFIRTLSKGLLAQVKEKFSLRLEQDDCSLREEVKEHINRVLIRKKTLSPKQTNQIREYVLDEVFGFGPLGPILRNPHAANIYLEGLERAYVEKYGPRGSHQLQKLKLPFEDEEHLLDVIHRIIRPLGHQLSNETPTVNAVLPNGSRVYAAIAPVTVHGPTLSLICRELSIIEILPHWRASFSHFNSVHEARPETFIEDGVEKHCIRLTLNEFKTDCHFQQSFSARSFCGKQVHFNGRLALEDEEKWTKDPTLPDELAGCYTRGAEASITAFAAGDKRLTSQTIKLSLEDGTEADKQFQCSLVVPPQTFRISVSVHLRGPIRATISNLNFSTNSHNKLRAGQGPKNLDLVP